MANTIEMLRFMRHAADLLAAADPTSDYRRLIDEVGHSERPDFAVRLRTVTAAIANAEVLLRVGRRRHGR